jgi:serine/threonine protein kinase
MENFEVLRKVAEGSAAEVFLARERSSQERVLLEVLRPELTTDMEVYGRFLDEAKERQGLAHPHLLQLRTAGCAADGRIFVVTEPVEDEHMGARLANSGPLSPARMVEVMIPICEALAYLHGRGLVHGCLRPSYVFLCGNPPTPKLMDTGLALFRSTRSVVSPPSRILVDPEYLCPERIRGHRGDVPADVYGLGVLMYELLTGNPPFTSADPQLTRRMHLENEPAPLPPAFDAIGRIVFRCLAKNPVRRYLDASAVAQALARHARLSSEPMTVQLPKPAPGVDIRAVDRAQSRPLEPAGEVLGSYSLERLLGQGGMGHVYLARHLKLDRRVAIKLLKSELASDAAQVHRFFQEARAVNRVKNDHIVEIVDFVEESPSEGGRIYCVMEHLEGETLRDRAQKGAVPLAHAVRLCRQVCDALQAAHAVGVVHRDVKPDNIFLTQRGGQDFVKVLDFGVAKLKAAGDGQVGLTHAGVVVGTPAYMAPEQALGEAVDARADVYSLASVLYSLLAGKPPFDSKTVGVLVSRLVTQPAPPLLPHTFVGESVPSGLRKLVQRCLAKSPKDRVASMAELSALLAPFERTDEDSTTQRLPPAEAEPEPRPSRGRWWVLAAVGLAALGGGAYALLQARNNASAPARPTPARTAVPKGR